jgi:site-specific DNA recombinase
MDAAIYLRISKDPTGEKAGVDRQEKECRALAERKGWQVAGVFADNDVSAWSGTKRPEYERMLGDIREGKVKAVVAWHLDRLTRSPKELEHFFEVCERAGVKHFGTVSGDIDLSTRDGQLHARILGAVARKASDDASARIRSKFDEKAAKGEWKVTGYRPYGYDQVGGTLVIHEGEAAVVREAARRVLADESRTSIIRDFHARGLRTSTGRPWSITRLAEVLRSPTITALRIHHGEVIGEGNWPAILDRKTWERVDKKLRRSGSAPRGRRRQLLTGTIRCGRCGQKLSAKRRTDGTRVYKCQSDSAAACGSLSVIAGPVEQIVLRTAWEDADRIDMTPRVITMDGRAIAIQDRLEELADIQAELSEHRRQGVLDSKVFGEQLREVAKERDGLQSELARIEVTEPFHVISKEQLLASHGVPEDLDSMDDDAVEFWRAVVAEVFESIFINPAKRGARFDPSRIILVPNEGYEGSSWAIWGDGVDGR